MPTSRFELNSLAQRWLRARDRAPHGDSPEGPDWQAWLLRRMSRAEIVDVGGVFLDRAILRQRFACVADRCAPGPSRGRLKSCCADALVPLSLAEEQRLRQVGPALSTFLRRREPRLEAVPGRAFFRSPAEPALARPGGRCVFSRIDSAGRIRCALHAFSRAARLDRGAIQPLSCRLFPLIVVGLPRNRVALTLVARHTHRLVSAPAPDRYPCLSDPSLPLLTDSLRSDLDWLFGRGFARALASRA